MGEDKPKSRKEAYYRRLAKKLAPEQGRYGRLRAEQERRDERDEAEPTGSNADSENPAPRYPHDRAATTNEITAFLKRVGGWFRRDPKP